MKTQFNLLTCFILIFLLTDVYGANYFYIEYTQDKLVFTVPPESEGDPRIRLRPKDSKSNQRWYTQADSEGNEILRSEVSNHCIDFYEGSYQLITKKCDGSGNQKWKFNNNDYIVNEGLNNTVGIQYTTIPAGPVLYASCYKDHHNNHFRSLFDEESEPSEKEDIYNPPVTTARPSYQKFYIQSRSGVRRVLDIEQQENATGARILAFQRQEGFLSEHQLWCFDEDGFIQSYYYKFVLDSSDGTVKTAYKIKPDTPPEQQWIKVGNAILNKRDRTLALTVQENPHWDHTTIRVEKFLNKDYQLWELLESNYKQKKEPNVIEL